MTLLIGLQQPDACFIATDLLVIKGSINGKSHRGVLEEKLKPTRDLDFHVAFCGKTHIAWESEVERHIPKSEFLDGTAGLRGNIQPDGIPSNYWRLFHMFDSPLAVLAVDVVAAQLYTGRLYMEKESCAPLRPTRIDYLVCICGGKEMTVPMIQNDITSKKRLSETGVVAAMENCISEVEKLEPRIKGVGVYSIKPGKIERIAYRP